MFLIYGSPPISDANSYLRAFDLKDGYTVTFRIVLDVNLNETKL